MEGGGGGGSQPEPDWTTDTPIPPFKYLDLPEYKTTQPEQEPVAWLWLHQGEPVNALMFNPSDKDEHFKKKGFSSKPLYTAPPKQWVGLTDDERKHYNNRLSGSSVAEEIEAKLKEKNT